MNIQNWPNARDYQYLALTSASKATREENFGRMFYALGHVLHLNQDLSQPEHCRDDAHPRRDYIEHYGAKTYLFKPGDAFPIQARGWYSWRDSGFVRLRDFWDRDKFTGNPQPLVNDAGAVAGEQLGLAEYSHGNFLGADALYKEVVREPWDRHYFPFPSLLSGTDFLDVRQTPQLGAGYELAANEQSRQVVYLRKRAEGITMANHATLSYLGVRRLSSGNIPKYGVSVYSRAVLDAYHSRFIPKAIEYSAGILDYFFRGRLEIHHVWNGFQYRLRITNRSGQSLNGGEFKLFRDDANGNRSEVLTLGNSGSLEDGQTVETTFSEPTSYPSTHTLVYKGTIGMQGGVPLDPVDASLAIAARRFVLNPTSCDYVVWQNEGAGIPRVRIKNYNPEWLPLPCAKCNIPNTSKPEWDGTFAFRQDQIVPEGVKYAWYSDPDASFPGGESAFRLKNVKMAVAHIGTIPTAESRSGCGWILRISCWGAGPDEEDSETVWEGRKIDDANPLGEYKLSLTASHLCNYGGLPTEFIIEAY